MVIFFFLIFIFFLDIYFFFLKKDFYNVDEIVEEIIDCVPFLIFMKALVDKISVESPPVL